MFLLSLTCYGITNNGTIDKLRSRRILQPNSRPSTHHSHCHATRNSMLPSRKHILLFRPPFCGPQQNQHRRRGLWLKSFRTHWRAPHCSHRLTIVFRRLERHNIHLWSFSLRSRQGRLSSRNLRKHWRWQDSREHRRFSIESSNAKPIFKSLSKDARRRRNRSFLHAYPRHDS